MTPVMTFSQLIPAKVLNVFDDVASLVEPEIKGFDSDCLKEVISIIACHTRKDNEATPLKITYIKKLVPQGDKYLLALINLGIVERSGNAVLGKVCFQYSFAPEYKSKYNSLPLQNAKLIRRIESVHETLRKAGAKTARGRLDQIRYIKRMTIDPGYSDVLDHCSNVDRYNSRRASVTRIENGEIFYSVDRTSGRFHSNVTNLSSDLRPYLRVNGESLVNIDIKNSQPYLSTVILTDPSKVSWMTTNPDFTFVLQTLKVSHNEDVKKYISLVVSGELYEYLMGEFAQAGLILDRGETKRQVLRILFARNRKPKDPTNAKARDIFKECFPTVHKIFSKVRGSNGGDKFNNFKRFAILLQKIEAYLMLDVILKRIYREHPGVIAITIHDSVMTGLLTNKVEAVREIITEELSKFVGFQPQIKIEGEGINGEGNKGNTNTVLEPLYQSEYQPVNN